MNIEKIIFFTIIVISQPVHSMRLVRYLPQCNSMVKFSQPIVKYYSNSSRYLAKDLFENFENLPAQQCLKRVTNKAKNDIATSNQKKQVSPDVAKKLYEKF